MVETQEKTGEMNIWLTPAGADESEDIVQINVTSRNFLKNKLVSFEDAADASGNECMSIYHSSRNS